mmetsp:Transcript_68844/g.183365  ORF Transcript_68844/g.183365 Transcript_68844/m.183365 type:complete len:210 (+) Transcript_68844:476-1105(+)
MTGQYPVSNLPQPRAAQQNLIHHRQRARNLTATGGHCHRQGQPMPCRTCAHWRDQYQSREMLLATACAMTPALGHAIPARTARHAARPLNQSQQQVHQQALTWSRTRKTLARSGEAKIETPDATGQSHPGRRWRCDAGSACPRSSACFRLCESVQACGSVCRQRVGVRNPGLVKREFPNIAAGGSQELGRGLASTPSATPQVSVAPISS